MRRWFKGWAIGLVLAAGVQAAWAQLYTRDSEFGADTVVVDLRTGLSWLQLSSSTGLTSDDLGALFESGYVNGAGFTIQSGAYAGYRLAGEGEISNVIDSYVRCAYGPCAFSWSDTGTYDPAYIAPALDLIRLFGGNLADDGRSGFMSGLTTQFRNTVLWTGTSTSYTNADHFGSPNGMAYLIAPVPEPSTYALLLAGVVGVAYMGRRRRRQ